MKKKPCHKEQACLVNNVNVRNAIIISIPNCQNHHNYDMGKCCNLFVFFILYSSGLGRSGQCITYEAVNQAYLDARKRISKYLPTCTM